MDTETKNRISKKLEKNLTIRRAVREVKIYCKKHGVFAYNEYMDRHFIDLLDKVMKHTEAE